MQKLDWQILIENLVVHELGAPTPVFSGLPGFCEAQVVLLSHIFPSTFPVTLRNVGWHDM